MKAALPVAVAVKEALEEVNGTAPLPMAEQAATLAGIEDVLLGMMGATSAAKIAAKAQKAATKAQKKIAKLEAKEAKQEAKIAAKVAKLEAAGKTAKAQKVLAKDAKQDAKVAAKLVKLQNTLTAANTALQTAQAAVAPSTPVTPAQAAAAVITEQAQLPATPAVQQLAEQVVQNAAQPGSVIPTASMTTATPSAEPATSTLAPTTQQAVPQFFAQPSGGGGAPLTFDYPQGGDAPAPAAESGGGFFDNVPPLALVGGAVALFFLLKGARR